MNADVRAAREKNGVYISHERFVKEEAEKKVIYLFSVSAYLHNVTIILLGFFFLSIIPHHPEKAKPLIIFQLIGHFH